MDDIEKELEAWLLETYHRRREAMREVRLLRQKEKRIGKLLGMLETEKLALGEDVTDLAAPQPEGDPILWTTPSRTQTGVTHTIRQGSDGPYCDCKAAQFGNKHCYHMSQYFSQHGLQVAYTARES